MSKAGDDEKSLEDKLHKALGAVKRYRVRAATAETEMADLDAQIADLTSQNEAIKSTPEYKRVEELSAELRGLKHKSAFDKAATKAGVRPEAIDAFYKASDYKADTDEVDDKAVAKFIDQQKAEHTVFFLEPTQVVDEDDTPRPGPASGQGGLPSLHGQRYTEAQMSDAAFVMKNYNGITESASRRVANGEI